MNPKIHQAELSDKEHIDGTWHTTEYLYRKRRILIKSKTGGGIKCHVFFPDSDRVEFTRRYSFINPQSLLDYAIERIDRIENEKLITL